MCTHTHNFLTIFACECQHRSHFPFSSICFWSTLLSCSNQDQLSSTPSVTKHGHPAVLDKQLYFIKMIFWCYFYLTLSIPMGQTSTASTESFFGKSCLTSLDAEKSKVYTDQKQRLAWKQELSLGITMEMWNWICSTTASCILNLTEKVARESNFKLLLISIKMAEVSGKRQGITFSKKTGDAVFWIFGCPTLHTLRKVWFSEVRCSAFFEGHLKGIFVRTPTLLVTLENLGHAI